MFDEDVGVRSQQGCRVTPTTIMLGIAVLRRHVESGAMGILVGDLLSFRPTYKSDYSVDLRGQALARLLGPQAAPGLDQGHYLDAIFRQYKTILLPYNLNQDFLLFEIVLQSERGRMVKVWDGAKLWERGDPRKRAEITTIMDVFFGGDKRVPVFVWEKGDPLHGPCSGAGAFLYLAMCYRALGLKLQEWTTIDEGIARSYLWGCLLNGDIMHVPKLKLV